MAKVTIYGKPTVYNEVEEGAFFDFSKRYSKTIDVPIPQDQLDKLKSKVKEKLNK